MTRYSESRTKSSLLTRSTKLRTSRLPLQGRKPSPPCERRAERAHEFWGLGALQAQRFNAFSIEQRTHVCLRSTLFTLCRRLVYSVILDLSSASI